MSERIDIEVNDPLEGFRFHEELIVAKYEIAELYHPSINVKVYRTFVNNPPTEIDTTARAYRNRDEGALVTGGLSQADYDKLRRNKKIDYIAERSLSVNDSHEAAEASGKKTYQAVAAKYDEETAEAFMEKERGSYVGGVILREGQAIMTDFKNGHAEVILNEDVRPGDLEFFEELTKYNYKDE